MPTRGAAVTSTKMVELTGAKKKAYYVFLFEETRSGKQVRRFRTRHIKKPPRWNSAYEGEQKLYT